MKRLGMIAGLLLVLALFSVPALAHEGREVGEYVIVFGWRNEPAYTTLLNGPEFTIEMHAAEAAEATEAAGHEDTGSDEHAEGNMVSGADETLQIEVSFGDQSRVLTLREVFGEPGHYTADLIPTQPGDYTFHLTGTINDTTVDETFSSADGEFSTIEPITDIQFP